MSAQVSCDFHDELEAISVRREPCVVYFKDALGKEQTIVGQIVDLFTRDHREFLKLGDGKVIELTSIERVVSPGRPALVREMLADEDALT